VPFEFGKGRVLREGTDVALLAIGGVVSEALAAAATLAHSGISARVISMHTLKPFDTATVLAAARETSAVISIEENSVLGGLGGAVAETCLEAGIVPKRFARLGMRDEFSVIVGDQQYLRAAYRVDAHAIVETANRLLAS
jgi:transketolase